MGERYGDLVLGKRNWQIASAGLMLLSVILVLGIVWISARTKVIGYIVEVDKLGYALTLPTALTASGTSTTVERRLSAVSVIAVSISALTTASVPARETPSLRVDLCGAGDRGRTGDVQLGKLAFYH